MDAAMESPAFHEGERKAQRRAGFLVARAPIRDFLTEQHQAFFAACPFVLAAGMAGDGSLTATVLTGSPGFIASREPRALHVEALPGHCDPFSAVIAARSPVGMLGIDFATRRRNRVNGRVASVSASGFVVDVEQSFGNCPKYIRTREIAPAPEIATAANEIEQFVGLDEEARSLVLSADTFFVASSSGLNAIQHGGVDISHRGGKPGFIAAEGDRLCIPDFSGNRYFNTFGNFQRHPEAALLFIDFASGGLLHLTARVEVDWEGKSQQFGIGRAWTAEIRFGWRWRGRLPYRWRLTD
jgi:predicted pyridoxine 5'-phosphate oxidase superfamily flavin-nucleotide-binding protein